MVVRWISTQSFAQSARSSVVRIGRGSYGNQYGAEKKTLRYSPWGGTYFFMRGWQLFWIRFAYEKHEYRREQVITISCLGRSPDSLKELMDHCRMEYIASTQRKTTIFEGRAGVWRHVGSKSIRRIENVIMDEDQKRVIMDNITSYLSPRSQTWYDNRDIPYRSGYLFYGEPGTGKSSLAIALAGHFGLDVFTLSVGTTTSESLCRLFAELPGKCIVLLEDIDAAGVAKSRKAVSGDGADKSSTLTEKISLSDLLNAIDGVSSQEGRILIMTTNHKEHLDDALIRPGRADMRIKLPNADKKIVARTFCKIFKRLNDDIPDPDNPAENDDTVEELAKDFARMIPEGEFSPADVQSFLVRNRASPHLSFRLVQSWISQTRMAKLKRQTSEQALELSHSHTTIDIDEPGSPRPLLAPSPSPLLSSKLENAGDSCKRANIDPFSSASGRTTPDEGLWMTRRKRNEHFVDMQQALYTSPLEE